MRPVKFIAAIALTAIFTGTAWAETVYFPSDSFLPGWKGKPVREITSRDLLFTYLDGGAETYLDYRFKALEVKDYSGPGKAVLTIEIYQFESPQDAYGIYSRDTSGIPTNLGQSGRATKSQARFWKGAYYVRAFAWQSEMGVEEVPLKAAQAVAPKIPSGNLPDWLDHLVTGNLGPMFIRSDAALKQLSGLPLPDNLTINENSGAAWISPHFPEFSGCAVLIYPDDSTAIDVFKGLWRDIAPKAQGSARSETRGMAAVSDTVAMGVQRVGSQVLWIPAAKNEITCAATLDRVAETLAK